MTQLSTEVVAQTAPATRERSIKKPLRAFGAAAIAAGLVGVFAFPAVAEVGEGSIGTAEEAEAAFAQALSTSELPAIEVPAELPTAEEEALPVVLAAAQANGDDAGSRDLPPAGVGAAGIAAAALAQLGVAQDCTDLAQNSLAAVGLTTRRDQGGYDHGVGSFAGYGTVYGFNADNLAPGDILVWPGAPHVAIYVGGGSVVHGGWEKYRFGGEGGTVLAGLTNHGAYPDYVVRVG